MDPRGALGRGTRRLGGLLGSPGSGRRAAPAARCTTSKRVARCPRGHGEPAGASRARAARGTGGRPLPAPRGSRPPAQPDLAANSLVRGVGRLGDRGAAGPRRGAPSAYPRSGRCARRPDRVGAASRPPRRDRPGRGGHLGGVPSSCLAGPRAAGGCRALVGRHARDRRRGEGVPRRLRDPPVAERVGGARWVHARPRRARARRPTAAVSRLLRQGPLGGGRGTVAPGHPRSARCARRSGEGRVRSGLRRVVLGRFFRRNGRPDGGRSPRRAELGRCRQAHREETRDRTRLGGGRSARRDAGRLWVRARPWQRGPTAARSRARRVPECGIGGEHRGGPGRRAGSAGVALGRERLRGPVRCSRRALSQDPRPRQAASSGAAARNRARCGGGRGDSRASGGPQTLEA